MVRSFDPPQQRPWNGLERPGGEWREPEHQFFSSQTARRLNLLPHALATELRNDHYVFERLKGIVIDSTHSEDLTDTTLKKTTQKLFGAIFFSEFQNCMLIAEKSIDRICYLNVVPLLHGFIIQIDVQLSVV